MSETSAAAWDVRSEVGLLACYDATFEQVYRYAVRLTGGRASAEDLTQEAFVRLVRSARAGSVEIVGLGWLVTTVRRLFLDGVRAAGREERRVRLVASAPPPIVDPAGDSIGLLSHLSDRERAALVFRYVDDLPVPEVAALLGASVRATESLLQRAKRRARGAASA